jgi:hypothetical protein
VAADLRAKLFEFVQFHFQSLPRHLLLLQLVFQVQHVRLIAQPRQLTLGDLGVPARSLAGSAQAVVLLLS